MLNRFNSITFFFCLLSFSLSAQYHTLLHQNLRIDLQESMVYLGQFDENADINSLILKEASYHGEYILSKKVELSPLVDHWSYIKIYNEIPEPDLYHEWVLEFHILVDKIKVFVLYENGDVIEHISGQFVPRDEKTFYHTYKSSAVKITLPAGQSAGLFIKTTSERPSIKVNSRVTIESYENYTNRLLNKKYTDSIYLGFLLMMFVYNLFLFFVNEDKAYLFYSIYLGAICIYALYNSGSLADTMIPMFLSENPKLIHFGKLFTYLSLIAYMYFLRFFLDLVNLLPSWNSFFRALIILAIPVMIIDSILMINSNFSPAISDIPTLSYIVLFVVSSLIFCIFLYRTKNFKSFFIITGVTAMSLGVLLTVIGRMNSIEFSLLPFKLGSTIEVLIFSLGLAYRQSEIEKDKQKSIFLQEQEHQEALRLKDLDKLKSKFYNNITHEFRTPLTVIMGMADDIKNEKTRDLIKRNSEGLLHLVNQILNLSKIENSVITIDYKKEDIITFLNYLTESFYSSAKTKNINLVFYSELDHLEIFYDEEKIKHIVYNLLSNAIKFSSSGDKIIFHTKVDDSNNKIVLTIKDTGIGISEADLPFIFDRFYQSSTSPGASNPGTGIGLALTKELVTIMNGTININSQLNQGTNITVELPIILNLEQGGEIKTDSPDTTINDWDSFDPNIESDKKVILIVDDSDDVSYYIKKCLENNFNCFHASNGDLGIQAALKIIPDIIVSDVMMPVKDGYELLDTLKQDITTSHIPIILLTAKTELEDKLEGLKHGADAYMVKPFSKEELLLRVDNMIHAMSLLHSRNENNLSKTVEEIINPTIDDRLIIEINTVINEKLGDSNFGINELCTTLHMSKSQAFRKIKALTGKTPALYIRSFRLKKARELLKDNNLSISEIAYDVGFNDPNYFSRTFHEEFGYAPKFESK